MCDAEHSYLSSSVVEDEYDPMHQLHESSVTYRIGIMLEKLPMQLKKITGITLNPWPILLDHYIPVIALVCVRDGTNKGNRPLIRVVGNTPKSAWEWEHGTQNRAIFDSKFAPHTIFPLL